MAEAPKLNFAAAASQTKEEVPLRVVEVDGQVVLRIVKHCREAQPSLVTGQLLGLDIGSTLEITSCFPFPSRAADEDDENDGANYQLEMMRCLREVNVDNNTVGWYQSTYLGSYQTVEFIETFLNYQENIKRCVCLVYDPTRSSQGILALKALRLTDSFMSVYRTTDFTAAQILEKGLGWNSVFQEIPLTVTNSALVSALLADLTADTAFTQADLDTLSLSTNPFLEKNLEFLIDCMEDLQGESQKVALYQRMQQKQLQQQLQWVQKRKTENQMRKAQGQELLPEDDPSAPAYKVIQEPPRLDSYLIVNQVDNYCAQITDFGSAALQKMYLMSGEGQQGAGGAPVPAVGGKK